MRLFVLLVLILFIALGLVVGALNADVVAYDFAFFKLRLPKGAALLLTLAVGWVLGGLTAWLGARRNSRRAKRQLAAERSPARP